MDPLAVFIGGLAGMLISVLIMAMIDSIYERKRSEKKCKDRIERYQAEREIWVERHHQTFEARVKASRKAWEERPRPW